jgi:hypothetical protein
MAISVPADNRERILKQAFADLLEKVDHAFTQEPRLTGIENERERYVAALIVVAQFFKTFEAPFADRFFELGSALTDLNNGTDAPLLERTRTGKRSGDSSMTWRRRAHAVLGVEGLMALYNCSEADALKRVESLYKPETLRTWRKEISANRKNQPLAERLFQAKTVLNAGRQEIAKIRNNRDALADFVLGQFHRAAGG